MPLDYPELAMRYVDLNPVRAGLIGLPWDWPWSSAKAHSFDNIVDAALDTAAGRQAIEGAAARPPTQK